MNEEDHQFEKHQRTKFCIFFIFFVLKQKDSTTVHVNEEGFGPKSDKNFSFHEKEL